jgi:uncharacterized circularly permuted ATP-grasp superfamily protein
MGPDDQLRDEVLPLARALGALDPASLERRRRLTDSAFVQGGVTFRVYVDDRGVDRIFPFDLIPRPIEAATWRRLERGLQQRVKALDLFLRDLYGPRRILQGGPITEEILNRCTGFVPEMMGVVPCGEVRVHIAGIDLVQDTDGTWRVLEDNLRCPSGVSYVLENRAMMKRAFPRAFEAVEIAPVEAYPVRLAQVMASVAPEDAPRAVILTPGPFNSAYFEHGFLARRSGLELVQPEDLTVRDRRVYVRTTWGLQRVGVIYRRIDDAFLDPTVFRSDSLLGVPGLFEAYRAGNVALLNAVGNGVADDKAMYAHVPDLIRWYLGEEPLLEQVETWRCGDPTQLSHVLANLDRFVVKRVDGAGGYGMLVGPTASRAEREAFTGALCADPAGYIAQPVVELSSCPVWDGDRLVPRRVDLRPYLLMGAGEHAEPWVLPGGLTRVALQAGSYVVNSSQGGGSKDTWVWSADPGHFPEARTGEGLA